MRFNKAFTGSAVLDVNINALKSLRVTSWAFHTLTLNADLNLSGSDGSFVLSTNATISLGANRVLTLTDLGQPSPPTNGWSAGTITGTTGSRMVLTGTHLKVQGSPAGLGVDLYIQQEPVFAKSSDVILVSMTNNLYLLGADNRIHVQKGGFLSFNQQVDVNQQPGGVGGIAFDAAHTGTVAVEVEAGGTLKGGSVPLQGGPDNLVSVSGAIYNEGGTVRVTSGGKLSITGKDANNRSYWQSNASSARIEVDEVSNVLGVGTFQIDFGTVQFTAKSGGTAELLSSAGLVFGNANDTFLTVLASMASTPGGVTIQGLVTLGQKTTTTLNLKGGNNTADLFPRQERRADTQRVTLSEQLRFHQTDSGS